MERRRREFLRTMSTAAVLPVLAPPTLKTAAKTGSAEDPTIFPAAASLDFRAHFPLLKEFVNGRPGSCCTGSCPLPSRRVTPRASSRSIVRFHRANYGAAIIRERVLVEIASACNCRGSILCSCAGKLISVLALHEGIGDRAHSGIVKVRRVERKLA
jgi:hypothetical protein